MDGVRLKDVEDDFESFINEVHQEILSGAFVPSPIKQVTIHRGDKKRVVGIMTLKDRLVHLAVKSCIEGYCYKEFNVNSFAYQPGKSAGQAVEKIEGWIRTDMNGLVRQISPRFLIPVYM